MEQIGTELGHIGNAKLSFKYNPPASDVEESWYERLTHCQTEFENIQSKDPISEEEQSLIATLEEWGKKMYFYQVL